MNMRLTTSVIGALAAFASCFIKQSAGYHVLANLATAVAAGLLVFAWLTGYAHLAARLSATLKSRRAARAVNGFVGAVLLALGGTLALARH